MSMARKCDRCGAMYEPKDVGTYLELSKVNRFGHKLENTKASGDLCGTCSAELMAWFHAPRNEENQDGEKR